MTKPYWIPSFIGQGSTGREAWVVVDKNTGTFLRGDGKKVVYFENGAKAMLKCDELNGGKQ